MRINNTDPTRGRDNRPLEQEELLNLRKENTQLKTENDALYPQGTRRRRRMMRDQRKRRHCGSGLLKCEISEEEFLTELN